MPAGGRVGPDRIHSQSPPLSSDLNSPSLASRSPTLRLRCVQVCVCSFPCPFFSSLGGQEKTRPETRDFYTPGSSRRRTAPANECTGSAILSVPAEKCRKSCERKEVREAGGRRGGCCVGNREARGLGDRGLEAVSELGRWRWRSRIGWTRGTAVGTGAGAGTGAAGGAEAGVGAGATLGTAGAATTTTTGEGTVTEVVTGKAEGEGTIGSRASTNWPSCTVTSRWVANFEATLKMERGGVGVPYSLRSSFALPVRGLRRTDVSNRLKS